jgi:hypothetical protein
VNETFKYNYFGLVAQVVECRLGMAEAPGSNPGQSILNLFSVKKAGETPFLGRKNRRFLPGLIKKPLAVENQRFSGQQIQDLHVYARKDKIQLFFY